MANIDYELAKNEIEKKFIDGDHRIVFWYDETKNFFDDVNNDTFDNVKTIIFEKKKHPAKNS